MINRMEIQGVHMKVDDKLRRYIQKKIGRLDRFVPRHARESMHAEVILKSESKKKTKKNQCEVIIHLPSENIAVKEATINMYAAVDIVEQKLKTALTKYKDTHNSKKIHRRVLARMKRIPFTRAARD